jgi:hypothetical protein
MVRKKPGGRHMAATTTMTAGTPMILLRLTCWQRRPCALVGVVHRCRRLRPHTPAVTASEGAAVERPRGAPSWQVGSCRGRWHRWHRLANGGGLGKSTAALHHTLCPGGLFQCVEISALLTQIDQPDTIPHSAGFRSSYSQSQVHLRVDRCMRVDSCGG